jgi:glycosyltransferase involved in cell wall biosynthesis
LREARGRSKRERRRENDRRQRGKGRFAAGRGTCQSPAKEVSSLRLKKPHQVLVDLSAALRERAGIPLVARHLAWSFAGASDIDASALISSLHADSVADRYHRRKPLRDPLLQDAEFLADVIGNPPHAGLEPGRWLRQFARLATGAPFPLIPFETGFFDEVIWENYFAPGLPASGRAALARLRFYRTPLARRECIFRQRAGLPPARLDTAGFDFAIFQNPSLVRVRRGTIKIIRCHDVVPLFRFDTQPADPHLIVDYYRALDESARDSHFVCVSESTREELISFRPELAPRCSVISNSLALQPRTTDSTAAGGYFLAVGTIEPRKNYARLLDGFRIYRRLAAEPRPLVIVANPGWRGDADQHEIKLAVRDGWLTWHKGVSPDRLADLYADAHGLVAASVHEGFGYPPLEAAVHGTPAVLSNLKVFRSHFGDAAEYFEPHDPTSLAQALRRLDGPRRAELSPRVRKLAQCFHPDVELEHWRELFTRLTAERKQAG